MSLGLALRGRWTGPGPHAAEQSLAQLADSMEQEYPDLKPDVRDGEDAEGRPTLFIQLHPAAEDVEITWTGEDSMRLSASTSAAGPGYHLFLCHLLKKAGETLQIEWEEDEAGDETGYFTSGDREQVYSEMTAWLRAVCRIVLDQSEEGASNFLISMPLSSGFENPDFLTTQLGPRTREWAKQVAADKRDGREFFPWWHEERDGAYFLNRALCLMWREVRWRAPLGESELDLLREVARLLEVAYLADPGLPFPWREWAEILEFCGETGAIADLVAEQAMQTDPSVHRIGYRRRPVRVNLPGGWTLQVPGSFADSWDEGTFTLRDERMAVWLSVYRREEDDDTEQTPQEMLAEVSPLGGKVMSFEIGNVASRAGLERVTDDEEPYWRLEGLAAADGQFCVFTICYPREEDHDQALAIWRSLSR